MNNQPSSRRLWEIADAEANRMAVEVAVLRAELDTVREHATQNLRSCPYCIQHNEEFKKLTKSYGHNPYSIAAFTSSPAFLADSGRWYHLQLCAPKSNSKGGYNWQECSQSEHLEYLHILGMRYTLDDAVAYATHYMKKAQEASES